MCVKLSLARSFAQMRSASGGDLISS